MKKLLIVILSFFAINVFAQDPLTERFLFYSKSINATNLFVHFDKNVYSSNETVWFTGYLITTSNINRHKLMSVSLIKNDDQKVVLEDRFLMQNGLSYGNLVIPDSIPPGQYRLLAITDYQINKQPEVMFSQPITIKSVLEPPFKASMKILETNADQTKILVSATTADNRFLPKPTDINYKYGKVENTVKTDGSGQAIITLATTESLADPTLYVKLRYGKDSTSLNMPLQQQHKAAASVKFYPEGGNLVTGLINNVALEVKNHQETPIAVKAYLFKNDIPVDSSISTNARGLGTFQLFVETGAKYSFKVIGKNLKDTLFYLPKPIENGIVLNVTNAVVNDTLKITMRAKTQQEIGIRVHNFKTSFLYTKYTAQAGLRTLKIPLNQVPKGLASITITDGEERPLAERIFFAHYTNSDRLGIAVDKAIYGPREKINLKLGIKGIDQKALVSIAVVQDARIAQEKMTDIESYTYLNSQLADIFNNSKGSVLKDRQYLEELLLVKGWRRYKWSELLAAKATDTVKKTNNLNIMGYLTKSRKPINKSVSIGALGDERMRLLDTDKKGVFNFNVPELYTTAGKKMFFFLSKNEDPSLKFGVENELLDASQKIALNPNAYAKQAIAPMESNIDLFVKSNEKSIRLQEVTITGKNSGRGLRGANACGDYVCSYGVFNCRNHYGDNNITQPIPGKVYRIDGVSRAYPGCNVTDDNIFFKTEGIHIHKEFYVDSYKDPVEPAYFTTLFWKYALVLDKNKEASLDFYSTDITGKFRVVVQGITDTQVIYGEKFFEVKKK
ncbi:hypothetical protein [Pedobacter sp. UBA4863]|uniref:hypothetical protein n=1 Tax=Pedobacter sp. UBA4863 TaxID=1947060 RepID=UPI0025F853A6|nr:hypothetical protein [Pedobacter sp. UBA4863]